MTEAELIKANHPRFETLFRAAQERVIAESKELAGPSLAERFASLPPEMRAEIWGELSPMDRVRLAYAWEFWARPKQRPPVQRIRKRYRLIMSGRGFGKNLTATNWIRERVEAGARSIAIIGPTLADIGKYQINGESGLIAAFPPHQRPVHKEDKRLIVFHTGAVAHIITAEEAEWRGGNVDTVWWDELAKSRYRQKLWDNLEFNLRSAESGLECEAMVTTTPLPIAQLKELVLDPDCWTIVGSSDENESNLEARTIARWRRRFGGTRQGAQEMDGLILTDNPDALFSKTVFEETRVLSRADVPELVEVAVAIDPSIATNEDNDPTAWASGGIDEKGDVWILASDADRWTPEEWGTRVLKAFDVAKADAFVGERNRGGDLVASNIRAALRAKGRGGVKIVDVIATRGKQIRAEPVAAMHEQRRIHFVGVQRETEDEMCEWNPRLGGPSPNRLDAVVWLVYHLAKLSVEDEEDYAGGFEGLAEANARLRGETSELTASTDDDAEDIPPIRTTSRGNWEGRVL
jgi:phage terminase large subunit-like protein